MKRRRNFTKQHGVTFLPIYTLSPFYQTTSSHSSTKIHAVTPTQLHAFTPTKIHAVTPTKLNAVTPTKLHAVSPTKLHAVTTTKLNNHSHQTTRRHSCSMQHCALPNTATLNYIVNSEATSKCPPHSVAQRSAVLSDSTLMHRMILCNG